MEGHNRRYGAAVRGTPAYFDRGMHRNHKQKEQKSFGHTTLFVDGLMEETTYRHIVKLFSKKGRVTGAFVQQTRRRNRA